MAKEQNTQQNAVKELVVDARFIMRSYPSTDKNGVTTDKEYLSFELINPFGSDEIFQDIALKAKWDKFDEKTNRLVRPDRVFGWMSYYARKKLRTAPEIIVKVTIKAVTYFNKRTKQNVTYPGMFADPTFVELAEERPVEVVVKGADNANTFNLLACKALGIEFTSHDSGDDDDIGLMD